MKWIHGLALLLGAALPFTAAADDAAPLAHPTLLSAPQQARLGAQRLRYRVSFDQLDFAGADGGTRVASISAIGYLAERTDANTRPVLFAFNGGPGASSVLQVEGLGPWLRVREGERQTLIANPHSILDAADLVFIDPPGTGFSQAPADAAARTRYWSDHGDAKAVETMIRHWLKTHRRERSPLYIAGESYGGYRLALLAADIADLRPAGVLLVSPLLDATSGDDSPGNDLRAVFDLPSLVVAAATHGKGELAGQPVAQVYVQARAFALGDYAQALLQGSALPAEARSRMATRLAALLGLPPQALLTADLRADVETFRLGVLATDGQQIGRIDSRIAAPLPAPHADNGRPSAANDPALGLGRSNQINSVLMADYLHGLFGDGLPHDYVSLDIDIAMAWRFAADDGAGPRPFGSALRFNPTQNLARLAQANPGFHVLALNGYYDLAVPALGPWYALHHTSLDPMRIDFRVLPTGHAVFGENTLRPQLHALLKDFLQ